MFPHTYSFLDMVIWCQSKYNPLQRTIVDENGDILITISAETTNQMLLIPDNDSLSFLSTITLIDLYHKLTFPQRAQIFEIFFPKYVELPKYNPPYQTSMFPERAKNIISLIYFLLSYQEDQWVDKAILGYLSIFSKENKSPFIVNFWLKLCMSN